MKTVVQIKNSSKHDNPAYATIGSAGMDLRANLSEQVTILPGKRALISTGIAVSLPMGFEARIQPRSGLAFKNGISVVNSPGCIDSDYRGDIGVILINHGDRPFIVKDGDRIAQMIISRYEQVEWENVESLDTTERGEGGFGHSGVK